MWDPRKVRTISAKTHHHVLDFNIFEGMKCHGVPEVVISQGRVVVENGEVRFLFISSSLPSSNIQALIVLFSVLQLRVCRGVGRFIPTPVFSSHVYMRMHEKQRVSEIIIFLHAPWQGLCYGMPFSIICLDLHFSFCDFIFASYSITWDNAIQFISIKFLNKNK